MNAILFDIQRNSFVDGPGIRTTVFFKGCDLRCKWCHNPESQSAFPEILFYREKCTGCGRCKGLSATDTEFLCLNDAKELCGKEYSADEVLRQLLKDKSYFENSGGGATFSGGECMLQIEFLCEILKKCNENGIHTAVDTAGNAPWSSFERILPYTDLFLYDIKLMDSEKHKKYTGVSNQNILANLEKLFAAGAKVHIRIPIIGGVNDSVEEMQAIKRFLSPYRPLKVELLPYHTLGMHKYGALQREANTFTVPDSEAMENLRDVFTH